MRIAVLLWAVGIMLAAVAVLLPTANAQGEGVPSSPGGERFLVFTNGDPVVGAAVRSAAQGHGGHVADQVRVAPDLAMIVVSIPQSAATDLAAIAGVREVVREIAPTPSGGVLPSEAGDVDTVPSACGSQDDAGQGSEQ